MINPPQFLVAFFTYNRTLQQLTREQTVIILPG